MASGIEAFVGSLQRLTVERWLEVVARHFELSQRTEAERARMACRAAAVASGRLDQWKRAGDRAWAAAAGADRVKGHVPRPSAHMEGRAAARLAGGALAVRDLVPPSEFDLVYAPFAGLIPLG